MNPFELSGPQFLAFFVAAGAVSLGLAWLLRASLSSLLADEEASSWAGGDLHPYEVAYLQDGPLGAVRAVAASMLHSGLVSGRALRRLKKEAEVPADAHPLEQGFHRAAGAVKQKGSLLWRLRQPLHEVRGELVRRGLWLSRGRHTLLQGMLAVLPGSVLLIGAVRLFRGVSAGRPVMFLVILMLAMLVGTLVVLRQLHARTRRGDEELERLAAEHGALRTAAQEPSESMTGQELALAMGLFGTAALATSVLGPRFFHDAVRQARGDGSGASACGSSCGSSCGGGGCGGGGCGGGCGGCGG